MHEHSWWWNDSLFCWVCTSCQAVDSKHSRLEKPKS